MGLSSTNKVSKAFIKKMTWLNLTLQDRVSPVIEQLSFFHNHALIIILIIITAVFCTIIRIGHNKQTRRFVLEGQIIETIWTIAPVIISVFIALPSLRLLYPIDEIHNPVITLKQQDTSDTEVMNTQTLQNSNSIHTWYNNKINKSIHSDC